MTVRNKKILTQTDYGLLIKNKEEQRLAKEMLLTERKFDEKALQSDEPPAFGKKQPTKSSREMISTLRSYIPFLFGITVIIALFIGFRLREFEFLYAEKGVGYALGIIGGGMMLTLLLYPLRKRYKVLRIMGNVRAWFGLHMVLGVLGPVLILFHSNFSLGSTNSNVALFSMLTVSISGVIGRYIYTKIHHGLYGHKVELAQLKNRLHNGQQELTALLHLNSAAKEELFTFVDHILTPTNGLLHSWIRIVTIGIRSRFLVRRIKKIVLQDMLRNSQGQTISRKEIKSKVRLILSETNQFLRQTKKIVEFSFYERMFALWHVLHLPLFFMLVIAAIVHVVAVHWY